MKAKIKYLFQFISLLILINNVAEAAKQNTPKDDAKTVLKEIVNHNSDYIDLIDEEYYKRLKRMPRVTVLTCSDSRIDPESFGSDVFNDFFVIRNVGNQIKENITSIEYGVRHMSTPVLIILGHSDCRGAAIAVNSESHSVPRKDKATKSPLHTIKNINDQVNFATDVFADLIKSEKLVVIGAVYDFSNELGHGNGKFVVINVNGEQNPTSIRKNSYLQDIKKISIGYKDIKNK